MKIIAIVSGENAASTQYRLVDYLAFLNLQGIEVSFITKDKLRGIDFNIFKAADLVINQKCLLSLSLSKKIRSHSKRILFDFDDAIYTRPGEPYSLLTQWRVSRRLKFWLQHADRVIVANRYLASYASQFASRVAVIPMALDLSHWHPLKKQKTEDIVIGWAGAPHNLWYLEKLEKVFEKLFQRNPQIKLVVYSGKKPSLKIPFHYVPFKQGTEPSFIQSLDIGLLPLPDEEYSHGKSPIKAIQYLACGIPVVGNILGAAKEIIDASNGIHVSSEEDWISALEKLAHNPALRSRMGESGRYFVNATHNQSEVVKQLLKLIKEDHSCQSVR